MQSVHLMFVERLLIFELTIRHSRTGQLQEMKTILMLDIEIDAGDIKTYTKDLFEKAIFIHVVLCNFHSWCPVVIWWTHD